MSGSENPPRARIQRLDVTFNSQQCCLHTHTPWVSLGADLGSTTVCSTLTTAGLNLADSGRSGREVRTSAGLYRGGRKDSMGRRSMLSSLASSLASLQAAFSSGSSCCSCCSCDIEFGSTKGTWLLLSPPPPAPSTPAPTPPHLISDIHISFLTCPSHFS